jgi:hypothetical protein
MADHDARTTTVIIARAVTWVVYAFVLVSELLLVQGFVLRLLGADPSSGYVEWAYRSLDRVMSPFRGIFEPIEIAGDAVLDTSILFAMVVYGIVLLGLQALLDWMSRRITELDRQHRIDLAVDQAQQTAEATIRHTRQATPSNPPAAPGAGTPPPPPQP